MFRQLIAIILFISVVFYYFNEEFLTAHRPLYGRNRKFNLEYYENFQRNLGSLPENPLKIAIVGAGIAGSSVASYLHDFLGPNRVNLSVFERNATVGGRTFNYHTPDGTRLDVGGTSLILENLYAVEAVNRFNLKFAEEFDGELTAIYDPKEKKPIFYEPSFLKSVLSPLKMLWTYSFHLFQGKFFISADLRKFIGLYRIHDNYEFFNSLEELLKSLEMLELTQKTFQKEFIDTGKLSGVTDSLLIPILRSNYQQGKEVSSFVGIVSSAPMVSEFHKLTLGTEALVTNFLQSAQSSIHRLRLSTEVVEIEATSGKFNVTYYNRNSGLLQWEIFDKVILAVPIEFCNIKFKGADLAKVFDQLKPREYIHIHVTFVIGTLNHQNFGLPDPYDGNNQFYSILTTDSMYSNNDETNNNNDTFSSIGVTAITKSGKLVYKIFSRDKPIADAFIEKHFKTHEWVKRFSFYSYPKYSPLTAPRDWHPLELINGLYYINSFESVVSTIETELISSKNIALKIATSANKVY